MKNTAANQTMRWTVRQFAEAGGRPWYALQKWAGRKLVWQATGYLAELLALAGGAQVVTLPAIAEDDFYRRGGRA